VLAILAAALFVAACWTANLAMYHYFAADFPTDLTREWHKMWGKRFSGVTLLLFAGFGYALWLLLKKKRGETH
jgi:hypothetical protein